MGGAPPGRGRSRAWTSFGPETWCRSGCVPTRWSTLTVPEREELIAAVESRLGPDARLLPPVLDRAGRLAETTAVRESLSDRDLRLVAVALGYAERRCSTCCGRAGWIRGPPCIAS